MDEVTDTKVYEYHTQVTVEVTGTDERGEFAIVSYHFDVDDDGTTVRHRAEIEPSHLSHVERALTESDYALE